MEIGPNIVISIGTLISLIGSVIWLVRSINTLEMQVKNMSKEKTRLNDEVDDLKKTTMPRSEIDLQFTHISESLAEIKILLREKNK